MEKCWEISSYLLEDAVAGHAAGSLVESYHYQSTRTISRRALMAGFLMLWLKRCILPAEKISANVILPAVLLCFNHSVALLPALIANIHCGLRSVINSFMAAPKGITNSKTKKAKQAPRGLSVVAEKVGGATEGAASSKQTIPRVEMAYTHLMAWFVMHFPRLMTSPHGP